MVPLRWGTLWTGPYTVYVSIYYVDGTVAITHGGVEVGQGINTKVESRGGMKIDSFILLFFLSLVMVLGDTSGRQDSGHSNQHDHCQANKYNHRT